MIKLENEVAIVTGAGRGIGAEIARKLAVCGCRVVINYNKSKEKAEQLAVEIKQAGGTAVAVQADVTRSDEVNKML